MAKTQVPGGYIEDDAITTAKIADNTIQVAHLHSSHGITTDNIGQGSSNKYYTDAQVDTRLAASKSTNLFTTGNIEIGSDTGKLRLGTGADLRLYHNGTTSFIDNFTGDLVIQQGVDDADIILKTDDGSGGTTAYITIDGSAENTRFDKHTKHQDNVKAFFGTGADLQIYHDGGNSVIADTGTGEMYIQGSSLIRLTNVGATEHYAKFNENGSVELRYDNAIKFNTTSTGVSVTGTGVFSSDIDVGNFIYVGGNDSIFAENNLRFKSAGAAYIDHNTVGQTINIRTSNSSALDTTAVAITSAGNVTIAGNLTVQGNTTTLNTATLDVEDKNITLNKGSGDTSGSADGAGITVQDAVDSSTDATLLWAASPDAWQFSHRLYAPNYVVTDTNAVIYRN